ncbi:MobQ family relaxase [Stutzerimonas stutzeri]|uniref:MobQ family relaxase n=1 Tax=Stutzerimonas stutzeri TaxID=316 RepID=UPI00265D40F1|nr:MobQ family relaxase [Stutzerimonas stutzeri]MCF6783962.1 MobA/MobL family protein [Stutzerimonas stutzeri]
MAIYSASVKPVSRSSGRSATAAAAYRCAEKIADQRTGEVHDYRRRGGVEHVSWFGPAGCREQTTAELWNQAEAAEVKRNARVAREVLVALPHELAQEQRNQLAQDIGQALAERYGVAGTVAVHLPDRQGDQRNHHVHILMTTRRIDPATGQLGEKTRELDDRKSGPLEIEWIREMVEVTTNRALEAAGRPERVDRRSLSAQREAAIIAGLDELAEELDREPTTHEGPRVTAIRRECERQGRGPLGECEVIELNDARRLPPLARLRAEAQQLEAEIIDLSQRRLQRQIEQLRDQVAKLDQYGFHPPRYDEAVQLVKQQQAAEHAAAEWRAAHPVVSRVLDAVGMRSPAEREADLAREAVRSSPAVQEAAAWQRAEREREHQLAEARQRLSDALERMPPPIHAESDPPTPEPTSAQQSLAAGIEAIEQAEAAPEWIEWEDDQGEWLRAEDRPEPEPEPQQQRYSGPRMG